MLGNHCVYTLIKREFLDGVEQKRSYYSFDSGDFHFVVLDSCFRSDGEPYRRKNFKWIDLDNNGYSMINLATDGTISVEGFRKQMNYNWPK